MFGLTKIRDDESQICSIQVLVAESNRRSVSILTMYATESRIIMLTLKYLSVLVVRKKILPVVLICSWISSYSSLFI